MPIIKGGYYIKARKIQESDISKKPPHVREIWDWLIMNANHSDNRYNGFTIKRGQLFRTYKDIREGLCWYVGYRKEMYSENHTKKAMKALREAGMIATTKALGGVLITILNYDKYQNPKNYESTNESTNESTTIEPMRNQPIPDNNKNVKKEKNVKKKEYIYPENYSDSLKEKFNDFIENRKALKKPVTEKAFTGLVNKLNKLSNSNEAIALQILDESIINGWSGVFELKNGGKYGNGGKKTANENGTTYTKSFSETRDNPLF